MAFADLARAYDGEAAAAFGGVMVGLLLQAGTEIPVERLAGAPGFEPGNGGIKIRCLTTWLRPNTRSGRTIPAPPRRGKWFAVAAKVAPPTRDRPGPRPYAVARVGQARMASRPMSDNFPREAPSRACTASPRATAL